LLIVDDQSSDSSDRKVDNENTPVDLQLPRAGIGKLQAISKIVGHLLDSQPTATVIIRPIGGAMADLDER
jgi:hypothetical protein